MLEQYIRFLPRALRKFVSAPHRTFYDALRQWRRDDGDSRRYDYPDLGPESIVFDLGGFRGAWTERIFSQYRSIIHVFEPHPRYAQQIREKFSGNAKVHVHSFALGSRSATFTLSDTGPGSSQFGPREKSIECRAVEAGDFLREHSISRIDLMKVNIEGGEYDLLPHLIDIGAISMVGSLQVQFHLLDKTSPAARERIRGALAATHAESWCYPFVWEGWVRTNAAIRSQDQRGAKP